MLAYKEEATSKGITEWEKIVKTGWECEQSDSSVDWILGIEEIQLRGDNLFVFHSWHALINNHQTLCPLLWWKPTLSTSTNHPQITIIFFCNSEMANWNCNFRSIWPHRGRNLFTLWSSIFFPPPPTQSSSFYVYKYIQVSDWLTNPYCEDQTLLNTISVNFSPPCSAVSYGGVYFVLMSRN